LGTDFSFAKGVVYSNMIGLVAIPVNMWLFRAEIRPCICWGLFCSLMAVVFESDGVKVLLFDRTGAARHLIAIVFAVFSFWRASSVAHDFGRARAAASSPEPLWKDTDASIGPPYILDEHETVVLDSHERWNAHWSSVEQILNEFPAVRRIYEAAFPRIFESNKATETALLVFAAAFMLSGFMVGLASTGGAPMMVAFIVLKLSKGAIRAIRNIASFVSIVMWLRYFASNQHGLHMWSTSREWPEFVALIFAGMIGSMIGAWVRNFISRDHLLFCFYFLIWGDSALLLDVFDPNSSLVSVSETLIATSVLFASVAVCYFQPEAIDALLQKSDEMISILSPREKATIIPLSSTERELLIGHIEALKAAGRLSMEQETALNDAVERRDPRVAAIVRQESSVDEALAALARRVASESK
jgi:hypothetical protein